MARTDKKIRIFSALEVANICGVVNQTAINWIKNGYLKAFTTPGGQYRVYAEDLVDFLNSRGMRMPEELQKVLEKQQKISTVVIIDDDKDFNDLLKQYLEKKYETFSFRQAYDGFEAGRIIAETKPGLVLLDIDLPGVDGFRLCENIKKDKTLGNPLVVAITALEDSDIEEKIKEKGADIFLKKPIKMEKLPKVINELLETHSKQVS